MKWESLKLAEVIIENSKSKFKVRDSSEIGTYPFFTSGNKTKRLDEFICKGENIFVATGGKANFKYFNGKASYSTDCYSIKTNEKVIVKYLYYFLIMNKEIINDRMFKGAALKHLQKKEFKDIDVSIPPLAEQHRIVAKLDSAFAEIDVVIEAVEDINQNLGAIFEKILDTSTQQQAPSVKLKDVCDIHAKLISPKDEPYCNEPHIGAANIVSMSNELVDVLLAKEEGLISGKFPFGTDSVLYSKIRPYLRKVHLPSHTGICSADMYPLVPDAKILDRKYLYYLLLSQNFTDYAMSGAARAGMPKINRNHLFDFEFQLPALEVQRLIVKKMEAIHLEYSNLLLIQDRSLLSVLK